MQKYLLAILSVLLVGCAQTPHEEQHSSVLQGTTLDSHEPPVQAETHFAAGQFAESQKNQPAAIAQYNQTLKMNPKHLGALYRLGVLYAQSREFPKALEIWTSYVKANEGSADACANLGFCHELAGHPDQAETAYKLGLNRDPKSAPCHINYGLLLARRQRIAESLVQLQSVLAPAEAHYNIASVYESQGMKEQAKLEYKKALDINAHFADARDRLASLP